MKKAHANIDGQSIAIGSERTVDFQKLVNFLMTRTLFGEMITYTY